MSRVFSLFYVISLQRTQHTPASLANGDNASSSSHFSSSFTTIHFVNSLPFSPRTWIMFVIDISQPCYLRLAMNGMSNVYRTFKDTRCLSLVLSLLRKKPSSLVFVCPPPGSICSPNVKVLPPEPRRAAARFSQEKSTTINHVDLVITTKATRSARPLL